MDVILEDSNYSDDENEMNIINIKRKNGPFNRIIDSDSDDENEQIRKTHFSNSGSDENVEDSEDTHTKELMSSNITPQDEVSEHSDAEILVHNKSFSDEESAPEVRSHNINDEDETENSRYDTARKRLLNLIDSESSEEEREDSPSISVEQIENMQERGCHVDKDEFGDPVIKPVVYKPMRKKKGDKPKMMTGKEAAQNKIVIQSESQKRVRESNVSLPYHVPKTYSIKEFLQKRSKLASNTPSLYKVTPSAAIKLPKQQLEEISKKVHNRMKEVEEFYKSDTEEEQEEEKDTGNAYNIDLMNDIRGWIFSSFETTLDKIENPVENILDDKFLTEPKGLVHHESIVEQREESESSNEKKESQDSTVEETDHTSKIKISDLLEDDIKNLQPRLFGSPDDVIDLDSGVTKPSNVKQLVEKFLQHTTKTKLHKYKVELDIVGLGRTGEIVKETVSMNVDEEEEPAVFETPGAKLQKLREELQEQMAQKRLETWKQKHEKGDVPLVEADTEMIEPTEKDILDDEEEEDFEMTESEDSDDEMDEKPKDNTPFFDEEAEVDDDIDGNNETDLAEDLDEVEHDENDIDKEKTKQNSEDEESTSELNPPSPVSPRKKVLKRIVKAFSDDSDDDDLNHELQIFKKRFDENDEDDILPPNLPRVNVTPKRPQFSQSQKSEFDFLTPVSYLTGLQNLNMELTKFKTPESPFSNLSQPSPLKDFIQPRPNEKVIEYSVPKNLFGETSQTSQNLTELAEICSGQFSGTQINQNDDVSTTQDLLNVCSGSFDDTQLNGISEAKQVITIAPNPQDEIKSFESDDPIMSQLLDEAELERFKKKFESPVNSSFKSVFKGIDDIQEANATGLIDSDDENDGLELKKKNKKQKKLVFSDDEDDEKEEDSEDDDDKKEDDDNEDESEDQEEIDLHDNNIDEDDEEQQLERQIQVEESANYKLADFLENEAELSESEWGSADEDEKDLDTWEEEQGDKELFNEKKLRTELERIHMRQVLDEDNRDVKLLQEMLLDDGELHGTGRQRQFRWRTLGENNGEFEKRPDDDIFMDDEDESEEQFRKMRHKREMFLKKKSAGDADVDNILEDSQIFKVRKTVINSQSFSSQNNTPIEKSVPSDEPFKLLSKRGSFLSRDGEVLQRLAEYTKVNSNINSVKCNSRSFLFQSVGQDSSDRKGNTNKRKVNEGTPVSLKKMRLDTLSPIVNKKKDKSQRAKQLFGSNW